MTVPDGRQGFRRVRIADRPGSLQQGWSAVRTLHDLLPCILLASRQLTFDGSMTVAPLNSREVAMR